VRFADKDHHLLFVEPDGVDTSEVYLQGFSSSMPPELQDRMVRTLPGFARAESSATPTPSSTTRSTRRSWTSR
jgi:tRNA U34 5-carboxymethylaminomethyl modifying enzyme MnmG/GidA